MRGFFSGCRAGIGWDQQVGISIPPCPPRNFLWNSEPKRRHSFLDTLTITPVPPLLTLPRLTSFIVLKKQSAKHCSTLGRCASADVILTARPRVSLREVCRDNVDVRRKKNTQLWITPMQTAERKLLCLWMLQIAKILQFSPLLIFSLSNLSTSEFEIGKKNPRLSTYVCVNCELCFRRQLLTHGSLRIRPLFSTHVLLPVHQIRIGISK